MEKPSDPDFEEAAVVFREGWSNEELASTWQSCESGLDGISSVPIDTPRIFGKPAADLSLREEAHSFQGTNFWMISGLKLKIRRRYNNRLKFHWIPMQIPNREGKPRLTAPACNSDFSKSFLDMLLRHGRKQAPIFFSVREYIEQIWAAKNRSDVEERPAPTIERLRDEFCGLHWRVDRMEIFPAQDRALDATGTAILKWSSHGELREHRGIRIDMTGSARLCVVKGAVRNVDHFNLRVVSRRKLLTPSDPVTPGLGRPPSKMIVE